MNFISLLLLGIGLAMDASAVSIAKGMCMRKQDVLRYAIILGLFFGFFQALMPLIGWWIGSYFQAFISSIDHWIAFLLLGAIGLNMIRESFHEDDDTCVSYTTLTLKTILILSIATSIDALAVGISFAFLQVDILSAICIIGMTTFALSFCSVYIGNKLGGLLKRYAGLLGGCILIFIGCKILFEHLLG